MFVGGFERSGGKMFFVCWRGFSFFSLYGNEEVGLN